MNNLKYLIIGILTTNLFFVNAQNSVGIGTSTPNGNAVLDLKSNSSGSGAKYGIYNKGENLNYFSGLVGIGTTSPDQSLHVIGNIKMVDGNQAPGKILTSDANGLASWQNLPPTAMAWRMDGNLGTSPLDFPGTRDNRPLSIKTNNVECVKISNSGSVGIGIGAPSYQLQLSTNSAAKPTSNTWTVASDSNLKKDVVPYQAGLTELLKIRPVWFTYTGEAGLPQDRGVGVIAQELQKIAPYMVNEWTYTKDTGTTNETTYLGVDNGAMTYMLINSVKEQQTQIQLIMDENKKLKEGNREIKKEFSLLKKKLEAF